MFRRSSSTTKGKPEIAAAHQKQYFTSLPRPSLLRTIILNASGMPSLHNHSCHGELTSATRPKVSSTFSIICPLSSDNSELKSLTKISTALSNTATWPGSAYTVRQQITEQIATRHLPLHLTTGHGLSASMRSFNKPSNKPGNCCSSFDSLACETNSGITERPPRTNAGSVGACCIASTTLCSPASLPKTNMAFSSAVVPRPRILRLKRVSTTPC